MVLSERFNPKNRKQNAIVVYCIDTKSYKTR